MWGISREDILNSLAVYKVNTPVTSGSVWQNGHNEVTNDYEIVKTIPQCVGSDLQSLPVSQTEKLLRLGLWIVCVLQWWRTRLRVKVQVRSKAAAIPVSGHPPALTATNTTLAIQGFHRSRYLEIRTEGVEKGLACAVIVVTELEGMSCICPKYLFKENRSYFQNLTPIDRLSEIFLTHYCSEIL